MKRAVFCLLFLGLFYPAIAAEDQEAKLTGSITLPAVGSPKKRAFRGSLYRSRLTPARRLPHAEKREVSPYEDVVVSAHPRSFSVEVEPLPEPVQIEQRNASFIPRVLPVTVGTTVEFVNMDKIYHNVFSLTAGAEFDIGRKATGVVVPKKIEIAGDIELFCDIHPQMHAIILSLDTPYFTRVDAKGRYVLELLPAGPYEIHVFHPDLSEVRTIVELRAGEEQSLDFRLSE